MIYQNTAYWKIKYISDHFREIFHDFWRKKVEIFEDEDQEDDESNLSFALNLSVGT